MRHLAWLNAVPKPPPGSKAADPKFQRTEVSRFEQMKRDKLPIDMPPNPAPPVINHLLEMGITEAAGMGAAPLSWLTIDAWQRVTGVELPAWEARLIRHLSVEYMTESRRAEPMTAGPPWIAPRTQRHAVAETANLKAALGIG